MKMDDKHGCVLRIETVINHPRRFKVRRLGKRQGRIQMGWYPMAKGVANLYRYREISLAANSNYLHALAAAGDSSEARQSLRKLARTARHKGRSYRGFNPADEDDVKLFGAVLRGEHSLMGFRNQDIRIQLFAATSSPRQRRRQANRVSRLLKRLHAHGLIAKIPRSRRWRLSRRGRNLISTVLLLHEHRYPQLLTGVAA
jgi:hypothetical protein